jgi:hypothetical protein
MSKIARNLAILVAMPLKCLRSSLFVLALFHLFAGAAWADDAADVSRAERVAPGILRLAMNRSWPSPLPRYTIFKDSDLTRDGALANIEVCRNFGISRDGLCIEYFPSGRHAIVAHQGSFHDEQRGFTGFEIVTSDGKHLKAIENPRSSMALDDGTKVETYVFEERLMANYRSPNFHSHVSGLQTNPAVQNGGQYLWGIRRTALSGEVIWDKVYALQHEGSVVDSQGAGLGKDLWIGLNEFVFERNRGIALASSSALIFEPPDGGALASDSPALVAVEKYAIEINLKDGVPLSRSSDVIGIEYSVLSGVYSKILDSMFESGSVKERADRETVALQGYVGLPKKLQLAITDLLGSK